MEPTDMTIEVLKGIREDLRGVRDEMQTMRTELSGRLDLVAEEQIRQSTALIQLNQGLTHTNKALARVVEEQIRQSTATEALTHEVRLLGGRIDNVLIGPMGSQVRDHEERITRLEERAGG